MRNIFAIFLALLVSTSAHALPKLVDVEFQLNRTAGGAASLLGYQVVSNKKQLLKCRLDASAPGGIVSPSTVSLRGPDGAPCVLPTGAVITGGMVDTFIAFTGGGDGPVTLTIGTNSPTFDNLVADGTIGNGAVGMYAITPVNTVGTAVKLAAPSTPKLLLDGTGGFISTGKMNLFIEYLLSN